MSIKELCGCIHLHTTYSDGGSGYPALIKAANRAGLDYVCVTDHMTLAGRDDGYAGRQDGVFVVVGYEHNDANNLNHYLAFGVPEVASGASAPQEYIDRVREMGGVGFIAHPVEKRRQFSGVPPFPWTAWDATGFDGVEIWNQMSDWLEQLRRKITVLRKLVVTNRLIRNAPADILRKWDGMNRERFVSAIGSVDAHSWFSWGPFRGIIFHPRSELRGIRTHLLVDEAEWGSGDDSRKEAVILSAMRDGRSFMSNFYRGDARGARFYLTDGEGNIAYPGRRDASSDTAFAPSDIMPLSSVTLTAELPKKARIDLIRNGAVIESSAGKSASWRIGEPGVYRVEAYRGGRAWIYTNPFPVGKYPL